MSAARIAARAGRLAVAAVACAAAFVASPPANAQPVTSTYHDSGTVTYEPDYPCLPPGGELTLDFDLVEHVTDFGSGVFHYVEAEHGTATFVTPDGGVYSGPYAGHIDIESNVQPTSFAVSVPVHFTLTAADGSSLTFTGVEHLEGTGSGRMSGFEINAC
jgi:hypothetical protein